MRVIGIALLIFCCCAQSRAEPKEELIEVKGKDEVEATSELAPLDAVSRMVEAKGKVRCPSVGASKYKGTAVGYSKTVTVNPYFKARLKKFEEIVARVGREIYGRAPSKIVHLGSYNCRRIRGWPNYISEHGLANALDVSGFTFPKATRSQRKSIPKHLRGRIKVDMLKHWSANGKRHRVHSVFLQRVAHETMEAKIFRTVLGPSYPGHKNHLHLDLSPWTTYDVFGESPPKLK